MEGFGEMRVANVQRAIAGCCHEVDQGNASCRGHVSPWAVHAKAECASVLSRLLSPVINRRTTHETQQIVSVSTPASRRLEAA